MATAGTNRVRHAQRILNALEAGYRPGHPDARFDVVQIYRWGFLIRVIDPVVAAVPIVRRNEGVWPSLEVLPDETFGRIGMLFTLAPDELENSSANQEFEKHRTRLEQRRAIAAANKADRKAKADAAGRAKKAGPARLDDTG